MKIGEGAKKVGKGVKEKFSVARQKASKKIIEWKEQAPEKFEKVKESLSKKKESFNSWIKDEKDKIAKYYESFKEKHRGLSGSKKNYDKIKAGNSDLSPATAALATIAGEAVILETVNSVKNKKENNISQEIKVETPKEVQKPYIASEFDVKGSEVVTMPYITPKNTFNSSEAVKMPYVVPIAKVEDIPTIDNASTGILENLENQHAKESNSPYYQEFVSNGEDYGVEVIFQNDEPTKIVPDNHGKEDLDKELIDYIAKHANLEDRLKKEIMGNDLSDNEKAYTLSQLMKVQARKQELENEAKANAIREREARQRSTGGMEQSTTQFGNNQ